MTSTPAGSLLGINSIYGSGSKNSSSHIKAAAEAKSAASDFDTFMRQILSPGEDGKVSEEELFAGLIQEQIKEKKGDEALKKFQNFLTEETNSNKKSDGFVPWEQCARAALKRLTDSGGLTKEEADQIHTTAYSAAQLDSNKDALWDDRGGKNDPTMAVAALDSALSLVSQQLTALAAQKTSSATHPLDGSYSDRVPGTAGQTSASSHKLDGPGGFLFKPISEKDGKLAIVLPDALTGLVQSLTIRDAKGQEIEQGRYSGVGNGNRETYRFSKPGASYAQKLTVELKLNDGTTKKYQIADPAMRYD